jgi:hypothetical protein
VNAILWSLKSSEVQVFTRNMCGGHDTICCDPGMDGLKSCIWNPFSEYEHTEYLPEGALSYVGRQLVPNDTIRNRPGIQTAGIVDCIKAIEDLIAAAAVVAGRVADIELHGGVPDQGHLKALQQACNALQAALDKVIKHCACYAAAAAAIAAAEAALEAAGPWLLLIAV